MIRVLTAALTMAFIACAASAGTVSPGLELQMRTMAPGDEIKVLVVMKDRVDVASLDRQLHAAKADLGARHRTVLETLRSAAENSQRSLLGDLSAKASAGDVRGFTPHWLINGVVVVTSVEGVAALAAREDVEVVEADLRVELIAPLRSGKTPPAEKDSQGIGIAPGIVDIGARRVWDELGIDGSGAVVGILDTGVQGDHPALSSNWRGNVAPAAECWLDAAAFGDAVPIDRDEHGTHVMGTLAGRADGDTIGVAPGAMWIASNVINLDTGSFFDNSVIASLEFMADPDGDPLTTDDVPDVVHNSWRVNSAFPGYVACDSRWWDAIDACEAAGVVLTWSAGNEGPSGTTIGSPADRATTAYNCFSVGSTNHTAPWVVSDFSSRGPSSCGGAYAVKPEITAPGDDIWSARPDGTYQYLSGTSMAGPHVAGVVALMRAARPDLDVITIKEALLNTAVDLGAAGEDNDSGHGFVDAYAAVLAVLNGFGSLEGVVSDTGTGLPVPGAALAVSAPGEVTRRIAADAAGSFSILLPAATWTIDASAFGYLDGARSGLVVSVDAATSGDMTLDPAPHSLISGTVLLPDASPAAATVTAFGVPTAPAATDAAGFYSLSLPTGGAYELQARQFGFAADSWTGTVSGDLTLDFQLAEMSHEDFETGDFTYYPWVASGDEPWTIDATDPYEGAFSARSGPITDSQTSTMSVDLDLLSGEFAFWLRVSCEASSTTRYDGLVFAVDGVEMDFWDGEVPWTMATYPLDSGIHTLTWTYLKDSAVSTGADAVWVDFIGEAIYPAVAVVPAALTETLAPGATTTQVVTVHNVGQAGLDFSVTALPSPPPAASVAAAPEPGKGEPDTRAGRSPLLDSGGPDGYGYLWIDSDDPAGPLYDWVEINSVGTPQTYDDDQSRSFPLGFTFPYYGVNYTSAYVASNGFLSLNSPGYGINNASIPNANPPNALLAAFWDDLDPSSGGRIYTYQDVAEGRFIVEWDGVPHYSSDGSGLPETFQVILHDDGTILYQYAAVNDPAGCTVGIENTDGSDGLEVVFNSAYVHDDLAVAFSFTPPPAPWLGLDTASGVVPPGGSVDLTVTFDAADAAVGTHEGHLLLTTNDPDNTQVVVPVTLAVAINTSVDEGLPTLFALDAASPNPFNPSTTIRFSVPVGGAEVSLELFDLLGRRVKTLAAGPMSGGRHAVVWNGDDAQGRRAASGIYFYRLAGRDFTATRKMTLVQ